ncbi:ESPR-type extended signal peptide-containing protein [Paraburkholderia phymatum]|uniref:ESPR-type extended signal peptide-containing protein n=1 Tax=Paraburkholderia phymatum TaxID=148447 RepID=A0ACC6U1L7_9BURK
MNKIYKSVWNEAAGTYVAAAENTRAHGKKSSRCALNIASAAIASAFTFGAYGAAWAADPGLTPKPTSSAANLVTPAPTSDWFCFLFWCGGSGGTTSITYNGVNAQDAYAYTYDRNNLKYFHVDSHLADASASGGGGDAIAIGGAAKANGISKDGSTYGWPGSTAGNGPIAIGGEAVAQGAANVALGIDAKADGLYHAVALGGNAQAADIYTVAVGGHALASAQASTALGSHASALANGSVALGESSLATRGNTVSVGRQGAERQIVNIAAGSAGTDAVNVNQLNAAIASIGDGGNGGGDGGGNGGGNLPADLRFFHAHSALADASAAGAETVAIGGNATALAAGSVALGSNSIADRANTISVGNDLTNRQITHLAAGTANTDAVNVAQLNTTVQNALAGGGRPDLVAYDSSAHTALTLGGVGASHPVQLMNVAAGAIVQNSTDAVNGSQMFQLAQSTQQGFQDMGSGMSALAQSTAAALGGNASANTTDGSIAPPNYTIAGQTYHNVGEAIGALAAHGGGSSADSVNYDTSSHDVVTLGGTLTHAPVALTNVANGAINANSSDAVNGKQMYATANSVARAIGAGSTVKTDGALGAPTYVVAGVTYNDVGSAINAIGSVGQDVQVTAKYVKVSSTATQALSNGVETTAIGGAAYASGDRSVAIGTGARAQYDDSVAIGSNAQVYESDTVSVGRKGGEKRVTNLADGINAMDAVNVRQLNTLQQQLTKASTTVRSMAITDTSALDFIKVSPNVMIGAPTQVSSDLNAMAIGPSANASGTNAVAVGAGSGAARAGSTAVGSRAAALSINSTVIGQSASTGFNADNGVSIGYMSDAEGVNAMGFGSFSIAGGAGSVALGYNALVTNAASNSIALGTNATASASGSIALGAGSLADRSNTISVGNGTTQRQVVNVAAGTANSDAVNVSQLKGVTNALGGGASVAANGSVAMPSYVIGGTTYGDVGSAIAAAAGSGSDAVRYDSAAHNKVTLGGTGAAAPVKLTNVAAGTANTDAVNLKQLKDLGANIDGSGNVTNGFIAYDDASNGSVTLKGTGGTKIRNVAAGSLSASSMEAVNGSQLYQTNQSVSSVAANVSNVTNVVNNIVTGGGITYFHANSSLADSQAGGANSVAIGGNAQATTAGSVALGSNARTTAADAVALGSGSLADRANTVSVGAGGAERQIVNVAAGTQNTDAVNLKQLKDLGASFDTGGGVTSAFVAYDSAAKNKVTLGGVGAASPVKLSNVAAGSANSDAVNLKQLKDLGASFDTNGNVTSAFVAYDDAQKSTVTLKGASGTKITNLAAGALNASSTDAINGSQLYQMNQNVSKVSGDLANLSGTVGNIGDTLNNMNDGGGLKYFHANSSLADSQAGSANSVAIGGNAQATTAGSVALGSNARTTAADAVALGSGSLADRANTVSVGAGGAERQIVNVAAGTQNTDAVNLKQLKDLGASFDTGGGVTSAFVAYDSAAKNKVTLGGVGAASPVKLSNVAAGSANSDAVNLKQLKDLGASFDTNGNVTSAFVAYDDAQKGTVTLKGAGGTKITNLAAGALNANSTDAINGSQLYQANQNVASIGASVTNVSTTLNNITQGGGIKYFHANSAFDDALASGDESIAIGGNAQASSAHAIAIGANAQADAAGSLAIGSNAQASAANSVALGANASTAANLAAPAYQPGTTTLAGTTPVGEVSVGSLGNERRVTNVAAGAAATDAVNVSQLKSAVDASSSGMLASAVLYDDPASRNSVTLGGASAASPVALKNVAPGAIASGSRDAINGSQLFNVASTTAAALGGGAAVGSDGKIGAPTYVIGSQSYSDVGHALSAINTTVTELDTKSQYFVVVPPNGGDPALPVAAGAVAVALGAGAASNGNYAMSIGPGARALGDGAVALGHNALARLPGSTAIGEDSVTYEENVISVGSSLNQRRITNVADGVAPTDVATLHQLTQLHDELTQVHIDPHSSLLGAPNPLDYIAVSPNVAAGSPTQTSTDVNAMAIGPGASAMGASTMAAGAMSTAGGASSTAVGSGAAAGREKATAVGQGSAALGTASTVIGTGASTGFNATYGVSLGYMSDAEGAGAMGFGAMSVANADGSIALGANSLTQRTATNSVALGADSVASRANTISVGSDTLQRQIVNVAAGTSNTDAVNVSQLKGVTSALGGGAGVDASGSVTKPAYTIGGQTYNDVGAALAAAAASGGSTAANAVAYDTGAHDRVTLGGAGATTPVTLANVAPGLLAAGSTQAVNGAQLYNTASTVAGALGSGATVGADGKLNAPAYTIGGSTYNSVGTALSAVDSALGTVDRNPNGLVYDSSARNKVTLGGTGAATPVTLANVADAKADSDAVNLKQLKAAGIAVDPSTGVVTNALVAYDSASRASVTFNAGGTPTRLKNVADGVDALDAVNLRQMQSYVSTQITNIAPPPSPTLSPVATPVAKDLPVGTATGSDAVAVGNGSNASGSGAIAIGARTATAGDQSVALGVAATAPATNAVALGANAVADRDNSVSVGAAGAERQITNVAAGTAATDAVNVGQMNGAINGVYKSLHDMDRDNRRGIAAASALNIVTPYLPGRTTLNAGVAGYRGTAALGVGVSRWNEKGTVNYNLGVSSAGGNSTIVRAGVGIVFGN